MRRTLLLGLPLVLSLAACDPATPATPSAPNASPASATPASPAAPAATPAPTTPAASPITITEATWLDKDDDKVGVNNRMVPNGKKDGHIRLKLDGPADVTVKAMAIRPIDKAAGEYSTWTPDNNWGFGIFEDGKLLNEFGYSTDLALAVNGGKTYDLYAEGEWAGGVVFFQPGMAYNIVVTDSKDQTVSKSFTVQ